jgi:hypothetical protein
MVHTQQIWGIPCLRYHNFNSSFYMWETLERLHVTRIMVFLHLDSMGTLGFHPCAKLHVDLTKLWIA